MKLSRKKILLINGSPRKKGTSASFARTIKMLAKNSGDTAEIVHAIDYFDRKKELADFYYLAAKSDVIAMIAPIYSDALPFFDIWLMEKMADEPGCDLRNKVFFAVGQCGFPDITRVEPLIDECRLFALETWMKWFGGLAYGGGAMIDGTHLENLGKEGEKLTKSFEIALENIGENKKIPSACQDLITVKIPKILYRPLAAYLNRKIKKRAKENGNAGIMKKVYLD